MGAAGYRAKFFDWAKASVRRDLWPINTIINTQVPTEYSKRKAITKRCKIQFYALEIANTVIQNTTVGAVTRIVTIANFT